MHRRRIIFALTVVSILALSLGTGGVARASGACADGSGGCWANPFSELGKYDAAPPATIKDSTEFPTAVSTAFLPVHENVAYWNGLENLETDAYPLAADAPYVSKNSRSRNFSFTKLATLGQSAIENDIKTPSPEDGGASDLFCADVRILLDGSALVAGGTEWNFDPVANPLADSTPAGHLPGGTAELFGSADARVLHDSNGQLTWTPSTTKPNLKMKWGRWYPAVVTLPDGRLLTAGGVGRLIYNAPAFKNHDGSTASGTNVAESEVFNPYVAGNYDPDNGTWSANGDSTTFPLFARLHLLPNGNVLYDGVGQMWGPFGQGYDEATWNTMKEWSPSTKAWSDAGIGSFGALSGAVSVVLPFTPDANGNYSSDAKILHAGGALGTSPDAWLATPLAEIVTAHGDGTTEAKRLDATLNNARWYSSGVLGADGKVYIFNGADKDEVIVPGQERAIRQAESFDPATGTFTALATMDRDRTYHNSAILLPDGRFLIGGHSPINNTYGPGSDDASSEHGLNGGLTANNLKDPSFQIFTPPYLLNANGSAKARPALHTNSGNPLYAWGTQQTITTDTDGNDIADAVLVRVPSTTHTTDADQREIVLKVEHPAGPAGNSSIKVDIPAATPVVAPPGFYYLFARDASGTPSVANIVRIGDSSVFPANIAGAFVPVKANIAPAHSASKAPAAAQPAAVVAEPVTRTATSRKTSRSGAPVTGLTLVAGFAMALGAFSVRRVRKVRA